MWRVYTNECMQPQQCDSRDHVLVTLSGYWVHRSLRELSHVPRKHHLLFRLRLFILLAFRFWGLVFRVYPCLSVSETAHRYFAE